MATVSHALILHFGTLRWLVVCGRCAISCVLARRFLLVCCCVDGFAGVLDVALTDASVLVVFRSLGPVTFDFGLFTFLFWGFPVHLVYGSLADAGYSGLSCSCFDALSILASVVLFLFCFDLWQ